MSDPQRDPDRELAAALAAHATDTAGNPGEHLTADELAAYHAGELAPADEARAQEHLLRCAECSELLLDLDRLQTGELGALGPATEEEVDAIWEAVRPHVRPAVPAAAALALAVLGLSLRVAQLRGTVAAATAWRSRPATAGCSGAAPACAPTPTASSPSPSPATSSAPRAPGACASGVWLIRTEAGARCSASTRWRWPHRRLRRGRDAARRSGRQGRRSTMIWRGGPMFSPPVTRKAGHDLSSEN